MLSDVDDLVLLASVSTAWRDFVAAAFRSKLEEALNGDEEGYFPVAQRAVPSRGTRKVETDHVDFSGGLLAVGDACFDGQWYSPNTTSNTFPAFLANELNPGWRREEYSATTMVCELGCEGLFPVLDLKGMSGWSRGDITDIALREHGARRSFQGNHLSTFLFYYSPFSLKSFAYMLNRIGQLQRALDRDAFTARSIEEGQLGDECWRADMVFRRPRSDRCPMLVVEIGTEETCKTRQVPVAEASRLASKLRCPFLRTAAQGKPLAVLAACRRERERMETITRLRPFATERRMCPRPPYPSSLRRKSDFQGSIEHKEVTEETWADHFDELALDAAIDSADMPSRQRCHVM